MPLAFWQGNGLPLDNAVDTGVSDECFIGFLNLGKEAACILTVSDNIITHKETTSEERQLKLVDMMKVALEATLGV